ncbi:MAG: hypothetical protein QN174_05200 [Armatimonadota bacterium]|nr:hypothetical protein [Armatimonadota bacterium]MDR7453001.1 hypothetical protein [Armatimonadota bacterium]MDR7457558.1 hypothetical protein [Armatimonadota bacterium]MDR7496336.1 hypothetical protein [Armatimonadota bacterium]MDR7510542.1 hypothetical protein [Armatimonadota bacterium]
MSAAGAVRDLGVLARLARDLGPFLRHPIGLTAARAQAARRLAGREAQFLAGARASIYGYPRSPYLRLLRAVGCEYGDLERLVAERGLDGALERLAADGVYVTFDEFKGRREAVRGSERFAFTEGDFDNPGVAAHFEVRSGGTRGPATAVKMHLGFVSELAVSTALAFAAHDLGAYDHVIWLNAGVTPTLIYARLGRPPLAWLYQVEPLPFVVRAGSRYLAALGRAAGRRLPVPAFHDLADPGGMAARLAALLRQGRRVCMTTYASSAVRVASAARERGIDLDGACVITLGEPFTPGKRATVEAAGARALVRYAFTEGGILGYACADPTDSDDLHLFADCYGFAQRRRAVGDGGPEVNALLVTSLLSSAPKVLLNVETGDYGHLSRRACGCALGAGGLDLHIARVRSFEKLSGEGMTFVQTDLLRVLEEVLPARFGGSASDYQLVEEERDGILGLALVISPRLGPVDEALAREVFLQELGRGGGLEGMGAQVWRRAETVTVRRRWPLVTKAGKILPFQIER